MPTYSQQQTQEVTSSFDDDHLDLDLEDEHKTSSGMSFSSTEVPVLDDDDDDDQLDTSSDTDSTSAPTDSPDVPEDSGLTYGVVSGDSLSGIAKRSVGKMGRYTEIAALNGIEAPYSITAGQTLKLPKGWAVPAPVEVDTSSSDSSALSVEPSTDPTQVQNATQDLGRIQAMDGGFYKTAGGLLDALVPGVGQTGKLALGIELPVDTAGLCTVSFTFNINISRSDKALTAKFDVGGEVKVSKEIDLYFVTAEAFAKAGVNGFIESSADNGEGVFRLMGLAIRQRLAGVSETVADALFDKKYIDETIDEMDDDDYVEYGITASASAGASGSVGVGGDEGSGMGSMDFTGSDKESPLTLKGNVGASASATSKTRLSKDSSTGGLKEESSSSAKASAKVSASLSGKVKGFAVSGSLSLEGGVASGSGGSAKLSISADGTADMSGDEVSDMMTGGSYLADTMTSLGNLVESAKSNLGGDEGERMAGSLATALVASSGAGVTASADAIEAAKMLEGTSVKVKYKLSASGSVDHKLKAKGSVKLQKTSNFKVDQSLGKGKVTVLVENLQDMFNLTF